jgi:hypothetical protein
MQKLVTTELGASFYIQRHFHWSDDHLLIEDHAYLLDPVRCHKDVLVDAVTVREYLESHGVRSGVNLTWDGEGGHSSALKSGKIDQALRWADGMNKS